MEKQRTRIKRKNIRLLRALRRLLSVSVLLVLVFGAFFWLKHWFENGSVEVVMAQSGSLEVPMEVEALVGNSERVVTSSVAGKIDKLIVEGERTRRGSLVARIIAQGMDNKGNGVKVSLTSPQSGLISYKVDGLEGIITSNNLTQWDLDKFSALEPKPGDGETVQGGQGVFKVVDNLSPTYLLLTVPKGKAGLKTGDKIALLVNEEKFTARVVKTGKFTGQAAVLVRCGSFLPQSLGKRKLKVGWLEEEPATGSIVPLQAVIEREGKKGIYVANDGVVTWREITVRAKTNTQACIGDGLDSGDLVVTNPLKVREGQIIKNK